MTKLSVYLWLVLTLTLVLSACSKSIEEPEGSIEGQVSSALSWPSTVRDFSIAIPQRDEADVKQPLAALLTVMSGEQVEESDLAGEAITEKRYAFTVRNLPAVRAEWNSSSDTFEAINVELARVREGIEIEEADALERADAALQSLIAHGVVDGDAFSMGDVDVHRVVQGVGSSVGGPPVESTKEYRIFLPQRLDGIIVSNGRHLDLGIRILVHRSGVVRGIRVSGLGLNPVAAAGSDKGTVDSAVLDRRVQSEFPSSTITPLGLRYSLGSTEARQVYRVSRKTVIDGVDINGRAKLIYYSVKDGSAPPQIWPTPNPNDMGDPRPQP